MQGRSCEMPGWVSHKLESRMPGKITTTSDRQIGDGIPAELFQILKDTAAEVLHSIGQIWKTTALNRALHSIGTALNRANLDDTILMAVSGENLKEPLDEGEKGE